MDIFFILLGLTVASFGFYYLDAKHNFRFIDWMNGVCSNPFEKVNSQTMTHNTKNTTIIELKERIAVLEKVVTEPAYELNKKLNML